MFRDTNVTPMAKPFSSLILQSWEEGRVSNTHDHGKLVISLALNFKVAMIGVFILLKVPKDSFDPESITEVLMVTPILFFFKHIFTTGADLFF
jgi:hypothetical protein